MPRKVLCTCIFLPTIPILEGDWPNVLPSVYTLMIGMTNLLFIFFQKSNPPECTDYMWFWATNVFACPHGGGVSVNVLF